MPHLQLQLSGQPDAELTRRAATTVADLTHRLLGKARDVTAVTVAWVPREQWFIGGETLSALGRNAFQLDITITDETNTKAEKARYLAAVFEALSGLLGDVHPCSYIYVIDARAATYGYGGLTQEYRYHHADVNKL